MRLTVLGSGPACPRPGGRSSGYLLSGDRGTVLIDCGHGVVGPLQAATDLRTLAGVVISHMHPDHYWELVALKFGLTWAGLTDVPLLLPPDGMHVLLRLQEAVLDSDHFFSDVFSLSEYDPERPRFLDEFEIRFARTTHPMPAWAMRFTGPADSTRALVFTSDTGQSADVLNLARGATLLLSEATYIDDEASGLKFGHLTARQAGEMAQEAGVKQLLLTHYGAEATPRLVEVARAAFRGYVALAEEGQTYDV